MPLRDLSLTANFVTLNSKAILGELKTEDASYESIKRYYSFS
jgi:hypothetical protein